MLIKLFSLIPIANASGPEIDQGTLMRFLAEITWFPTIALSDYIQWEHVDTHRARAIMSYGGLSVSGIFSFDENGDVISFEGSRYYEQEGNYSLETWFISVSGYKVFDGLRIPSAAEVTWKLEDGDFTWFKLEVTDVRYNSPGS